MLNIVAGFLILACLACGYFYYQGSRSATLAPVTLAAGSIPKCGSRPNCVCSLQDPTDEHFIEAIDLGGRDALAVVAAIESIGGRIVSSDDVTIQATVTSGIFKFVDDLIVQIDNGTLNVRSSSRVGHSDLGANRKRIELLRQALL